MGPRVDVVDTETRRIEAVDRRLGVRLLDWLAVEIDDRAAEHVVPVADIERVPRQSSQALFRLSTAGLLEGLHHWARSHPPRCKDTAMTQAVQTKYKVACLQAAPEFMDLDKPAWRCMTRRCAGWARFPAPNTFNRSHACFRPGIHRSHSRGKWFRDMIPHGCQAGRQSTRSEPRSSVLEAFRNIVDRRQVEFKTRPLIVSIENLDPNRVDAARRDPFENGPTVIPNLADPDDFLRITGMQVEQNRPVKRRSVS